MVKGLVDDYHGEFRITLLGGDPVEGVDEHRPMQSRIYTVRELLEVPLRIPRSADIVWSPNYNAPLVSPGRLVVTIHDTCHLALPELFGGLVKQTYARFMFGNVRRRAHHVICDSEFTAREVENRVGIERSRLSVVYPGASTEWPAVTPPRIPGRPYILYVGNVKPHKNLGRLLEAFQRLAARIPHDLVIVGKREGFATPDRAVGQDAAALGDRVRFTGEVSDAALRDFYAGSDLLVFPSLYEGFGFSPLEAMAAGIPVAASHAASIPEVCGPAAFYFDPYSVDDMVNVIEHGLSDEPARAAMRIAGVAVVGRYSWPKAVASMVDVFRKVGRD
jgi:glycosyltransferase involved in cell wall biosynthesis